VNVADNADLDPLPTRWGYAVFGKVIEGMEVVDRISISPTGRWDLQAGCAAAAGGHPEGRLLTDGRPGPSAPPLLPAPPPHRPPTPRRLATARRRRHRGDAGHTVTRREPASGAPPPK
jgi:hypothetical protein